MSILLYTKPNCPFCDVMKTLLDKTGFSYYTIDVADNEKAKMFLKSEGHRRVPQLYVNDVHVNKLDTAQYTSDSIHQAISEVWDTQSEWRWADSGIEQGL